VSTSRSDGRRAPRRPGPRKRLVAALAALGLATLAAAGARADVTASSGYGNGLIAYTQCCGPAGVYVVRPDGTGRRLVYRAVDDDAPLDPAWSPDGRRIAFVPGGARPGIWVMDASGAGRRRITAGKGDSLFPSWSPTGSSLVFADLRGSRLRLHDLYVVRADGSGLRRLTGSPADETHPAWAPNGRELAYERGRDLWRTAPDGSGQRLLARNASAPAWSPGGTTIAFVRDGDAWAMRRDGSAARRLVDFPAAQLAIAWSPDGRWLVTAPVDRGDLLLVRADGSQTGRLTRAAGAFHGWPTWQRLLRDRPGQVRP
jgi:TolB protein